MNYQSRHLSNYLGLSLVILGLMFIGRQFPLPVARPLPPGLFLVGLGIALALIDKPLKLFRSGEVATGTWHDVFWDMLLVAAGVLVALASLITWVWPGWVMGAMKLVGVGQLLAGGGALLAIVAALHVLDEIATRGSGWWLFLTIPATLAWGLILLLGLSLLALGLLQIAAPDALAAWMREIIPPIPTLPMTGG